MDEVIWLSSTDPQLMLEYLQYTQGDYTVGESLERRYPPLISPRKLRLFACAVCRQVWDGSECKECLGAGQVIHIHRVAGNDTYGNCYTCHGTGRTGGLTDPRSRRAVETAERFADGEATHDERVAADREASDAVKPYNDMTSLEWIAQASAGLTVADELAWEVVRRPLPWVAGGTQAALLRDIMGNPWRPKSLLTERCPTCTSPSPELHPAMQFEGEVQPCRDKWHIEGKTPSWLTWHDRTVPRMAERIYQEWAWDRLPILADALEDAGCADVDILNHCRGLERCWLCVETKSNPAKDACSVCGQLGAVGAFGRPCAPGWIPLRGPHARGCWVLDLLLGKE